VYTSIIDVICRINVKIQLNDNIDNVCNLNTGCIESTRIFGSNKRKEANSDNNGNIDFNLLILVGFISMNVSDRR